MACLGRPSETGVSRGTFKSIFACQYPALERYLYFLHNILLIAVLDAKRNTLDRFPLMCRRKRLEEIARGREEDFLEGVFLKFLHALCLL